ncbi:DNA-directed RNA polymerase subunit E'' [Candidatus Woesearchaeota archaeon]|nr:DNA-directed RNA polymerase subunit E'' [Candidatus Woesearchaeota archaeon]
MKRKACKRCKLFVEEETCPLCKGNQFILNWRGRLTILNPTKSMIAQKTGHQAAGEYTIKAE